MGDLESLVNNFMCAAPDGAPLRRRRLSAHAERRIRQRGLREFVVELVLRYGDEFHAGRGDVAFFLGYRAASLARERDGVNLDNFVNTAVILLPNGIVKTVFRQPQPRAWWKPVGRRAPLKNKRWMRGKS